MAPVRADIYDVYMTVNSNSELVNMREALKNYGHLAKVMNKYITLCAQTNY